jgi:predicted kinase
MITHGVSGSGKSHLTERLLETAGAVRLRSDVERKRLFGLDALDASASRVPGGIYDADATQRTYARLQQLADVALAARWPVIVDATFLRASERIAFSHLAQRHGVPFTILSCEAPRAVLEQRVAARHRRSDDASEADIAILQRQLSSIEPLDMLERRAAIVLDTSRPPNVSDLASTWAMR